MKSVKSAVVVIPPKEVWTEIQTLRRKHDKAYARWMPHINLIYPFVEDTNAGQVFKSEASNICKQLTAIKPFKVALTKDSFGAFHHGKTSTWWVSPVVPFGCHTEKTFTAKPKKTKEKTFTDPIKTLDPVYMTPTPVWPEVRDLVIKEVASHPSPIPTGVLDQANATGIDALRYAIWTPENTRSAVIQAKASVEPGLGALQFAYWTVEENKKRKEGKKSKEDKKRESPEWIQQGLENMNKSNTTGIYLGKTNGKKKQKVVTRKQEVIIQESESETSDSEPSEEEHEDSSGAEDWSQAVPGDIHPGIMRLQDIVQDLYPGMDDLVVRSPEGFKPHLTLGQGKGVQPDFDANWKDVEFEVKEICLISRVGFNDPFTVKHTIPLGSFDVSNVECP